MRPIDMETWDRREYFEAYLDMDLPYINIGANVDVTNLMAHARRTGLSSYLTLVFLAHQTAESIVNFRYRIADGRPMVNERMSLTFTHVPDGRELFINVAVDPPDDLLGFHAAARAEIARQGTIPGVKEMQGRLDIISYSVIPWIQYTHFVRTIAKAGVDSNPKMSWGRFFTEGDRTMVPFSVQVHHGLMDGIHIGMYFEALSRRIEELA